MVGVVSGLVSHTPSTKLCDELNLPLDRTTGTGTGPTPGKQPQGTFSNAHSSNFHSNFRHTLKHVFMKPPFQLHSTHVYVHVCVMYIHTHHLIQFLYFHTSTHPCIHTSIPAFLFVRFVGGAVPPGITGRSRESGVCPLSQLPPFPSSSLTLQERGKPL